MKSNPHPVPGGRAAAGEPTMMTACVITWKDGSRIDALLRSSYSTEEGRVMWTGSAHKIDPIPTKSDACMLEAFLRDQAKKTGGRFELRNEGYWLAKDEVKA